MGWTTTALVVLGLVFGRKLRPKLPAKPKINDFEHDFEHASGFDSIRIDTTTPVPIVIGRTATSGHIIKGYVLGENDNRLLGAIAIGENIGDSELLSFRIGDVEFSSLSTYSTSRHDENSWYEYFSEPIPQTFTLNNIGKKPVFHSVYEGEDYVSEYIQVFGNANIQLEFELYFNSGGTTYEFTVEYRTKYNSEWTQVSVPQAKGSASNIIADESYHGSEKITVPLSGLYSNSFQFRVNLQQCTNQANLHIRYINITSDTGGEVTITSPGCSYILFHLVKTSEIKRLNFLAEVRFPFDNPAKAIEFFFLNREIGMGLDPSLIDFASFRKAQQYCQQKNITIGMTLSNTTYDVLIESLLSCALLSLTKVGGIFKLITPEVRHPVVHIDIKRDIIPGSLSLGLESRQNSMNRLRIRYSDPNKLYTRNDILMEDTRAIEHHGGIREKMMDLSGLNDMATAQYIAETTYNIEARGAEWISFSLDIGHSWLEPGQDIISLTHEDLALFQEEYQTVSIEESMDEDNLFGVKVTARRYESDDLVSKRNWRTWVDEPESLGKPFSGTVITDNQLQEVKISRLKQKIITEDLYDNIEGDTSIPSSIEQYIRCEIEFTKAGARNLIGYVLRGTNEGNYHSGNPGWITILDLINPDVDKITVDYLADDVHWHLKLQYLYLNDKNEVIMSKPQFSPTYSFTTQKIASEFRIGGWRDYYFGVM